MATQSFVIQREEEIIAATEAMWEALRAYQSECRTEGTGRPSPENRDVWGTLHVNTVSLKRAVDVLLAAMEQEFHV